MPINTAWNTLVLLELTELGTCTYKSNQEVQKQIYEVIKQSWPHVL